MAGILGLLDMSRTAASYGFQMLVDAGKLEDRLLKPLELPKNVVRQPIDIDFSSCDLAPSKYLGELSTWRWKMLNYVSELL